MAMKSSKFFLFFGMISLCVAPIFAQAQTLTFLPKIDYPTQGANSGRRPSAVAVGDLNGDTYPDIISTNANSNNISVFLNNGASLAGTFANAVTYSIGNTPLSLVIADLNGDTFLDVAVANNGTSTVAVRFGVGDGTFQVDVAYDVGGSPTAIAVGDVNNDTFLDLVTVGTAGTQSVLLNAGNGTFPTILNSPTDPATGLVLADFDEDSKLDIALSTNTLDRVSVGKGAGDGTFASLPNLALPIGGALGIRTADVDGDQILDILTANTGNGLNGSTSYRKGDGLAEFLNISDIQLGFIPVSLELSDLDNDGIYDYIFVNNNQSELSLGKGNGDGTFQSLENFATGTDPNGAAIADVNKDGKTDIITANFNANSISVLINTTPSVRVSVLGTIQLEQTASAAVPLNFTFTPQDGSAIFSRTIIPAATGEYTIADVPRKVYTVGIKGAKWLRSSVVTDTTLGDVTGLNVTLRGGDANDDNAVDISDLLLLIAHYNQQQGTEGYLETADFNSDDFCDISDLLLLIGNYNVLGSP